MDFRALDIFIQAIVFLFAISVHESAHAWMANKQGDPTAMMLGRITLNPLKHIDPFGSIIFPLVGLFSGVGILGWAKPTPVTPENFRNPVRGDILTTVAGPVSNLILVTVSTLMLAAIALTSVSGKSMVLDPRTALFVSESPLALVVWVLTRSILLNATLFIFNLLPVPPLDGSHILRHGLPVSVRNAYDRVGMVGLLLLFLFGGPIVFMLTRPILFFVQQFLRNI
jgi:Zn-dependent protease